MQSKLSTIIGWTSTILIGAFMTFSAVMKFVPVEPGSDAEKMLQRLGITITMDQILGVLELIIIALFLIPRTSTVGFVLMVGYLGGALATNLTHGFSNVEAIPIYVIFAVLTLSAYFRNPELLSRLRKSQS